VPEVSFAWQGGEPTLLGVGYFRKVVELQARYANGKTIGNSIQTNGTLLDDEWCTFFKENRFLVGISIDGPRELHELYRVDKLQRSTFDKVMAGIELLKRHRVDFNTLTVVHRESARHPLEVYRFLKEIGSTYIQFIPLVERSTGTGLAAPPLLSPTTDDPALSATVTPWSVDAHDYGNFLVDIFQEWVRHDVGRIFVQVFETALSNWMGLGSTLCIFAETCGRALALEHNGDVYSCDHYVYPHYKLGNLLNQEIEELAELPSQQSFGAMPSGMPCRTIAGNARCVSLAMGNAQGIDSYSYPRWAARAELPMRGLSPLLSHHRSDHERAGPPTPCRASRPRTS
jgi:uncharacterized protein